MDCAVNGPWNGVRGAAMDPVPSRAATTRRTLTTSVQRPPRPPAEVLGVLGRCSPRCWRSSMEVSDDIIDVRRLDREPVTLR